MTALDEKNMRLVAIHSKDGELWNVAYAIVNV